MIQESKKKTRGSTDCMFLGRMMICEVEFFEVGSETWKGCE